MFGAVSVRAQSRPTPPVVANADECARFGAAVTAFVDHLRDQYHACKQAALTPAGRWVKEVQCGTYAPPECVALSNRYFCEANELRGQVHQCRMQMYANRGKESEEKSLSKRLLASGGLGGAARNALRLGLAKLENPHDKRMEQLRKYADLVKNARAALDPRKPPTERLRGLGELGAGISLRRQPLAQDLLRVAVRGVTDVHQTSLATLLRSINQVSVKIKANETSAADSLRRSRSADIQRRIAARVEEAQRQRRVQQEREAAAAREAERIRRQREAEEERRRNYIPPGWEACSCPGQHAHLGKFVAGRLFHPPGLSCY
jgi:hypothetical protein